MTRPRASLRHGSVGRALLRVRALRRAGHADPLEPGRRPQARLRPHQGHRALRRGPAGPGDPVRGAQPARGPGPDRVGRERRPPPALPADRRRRRGAAGPPGHPASDRRRGAAPPGRDVGAGMSDGDASARRAGPRVWCAGTRRSGASRYGEEFVELLVADMEERPHSLGRALERGPQRPRGPAGARRASAVSRSTADEGERRSLVAVGGALVDLLVVRARHVVPADDRLAVVGARHRGDVHGHGGHVGGCRGRSACCAVASPPSRRLVGRCGGSSRTATRSDSCGRCCSSSAGSASSSSGTHHFANGWPGTGGHPWVHQGIVPGGVAAYAWASTLFVTSYWAHPAALAGVPPGRGGLDGR